MREWILQKNYILLSSYAILDILLATGIKVKIAGPS